MPMRRFAAALIVLLAPLAAVAQPAREAELRAAITAEPGDLDRYFRLADYYQERGELDRADRVLQDALGIDPSSRTLHERRVRLFANPFEPSRVGRIALEWLSVDGTNPVPVLLSTGHRLRRASARRGDGTTASLDEADAALRDLDGAVPANPFHPGLAAARVTLLQAKAALAPGTARAEEWLAEARAANAHAESLAKRGPPNDAGLGPLAETVAAMLRPVPWGPPGAVRAGVQVPRPRLVHHVPVPRVRPAPATTRRLLTLEVVVDERGSVAQIFPLDSSEGYSQSIGEAILRWRFEPTRLDGQPVPVILTVTTFPDVTRR